MGDVNSWRPDGLQGSRIRNRGYHGNSNVFYEIEDHSKLLRDLLRSSNDMDTQILGGLMRKGITRHVPDQPTCIISMQFVWIVTWHDSRYSYDSQGTLIGLDVAAATAEMISLLREHFL